MANKKSDTAGPLRIEYMPLSKLMRAPRNPKDHDLGAVHESIKRFGFVSPVVLNDKTGRLVAGHGRIETLQQARAAGEKPPERILARDDDWLIPVIRGVEFADDEEAEAYVIADNRTVELGGWIEKDLAEILADHAKTDRGLVAMGYDEDDLDKMLKRIGAENGEIAPATMPKDQYMIIVTCADEREQSELLERLIAEGRDVRALVS